MFNSALAAITAAASLSSGNLLQEHSFPDRRPEKFEQPGQSETVIFSELPEIEQKRLELIEKAIAELPIGVFGRNEVSEWEQSLRKFIQNSDFTKDSIVADFHSCMSELEKEVAKRADWVTFLTEKYQLQAQKGSEPWAFLNSISGRSEDFQNARVFLGMDGLRHFVDFSVCLSD